MTHETKHIIKQSTETVERKIMRLYTDKVNPGIHGSHTSPFFSFKLYVLSGCLVSYNQILSPLSKLNTPPNPQVIEYPPPGSFLSKLNESSPQISPKNPPQKHHHLLPEYAYP